MHKEERLKPGAALDQLRENWKKMEDFCRMLAAKDMEYLPELTEEELEHVLKMQGIRRYLLTNSLERAYQLFYLPKTIKKGIRESVKPVSYTHLVIEKGFQVGGDLIRSEGIRLESLAIVDSMDEETGTIVFRDDE